MANEVQALPGRPHPKALLATNTKKVVAGIGHAIRGGAETAQELSLILQGSPYTMAVFGAQFSAEIRRRPDLHVAGIQEILHAMLQCAHMHLLPGPHRHVALIPRKRKCRLPDGTEFWRTQIDVQPEWRGLKDLIERSPAVREVRPVLIHRIDELECDQDSILKHKFQFFHPERIFRHAANLPKDSPPDLIGGYLEIHLLDAEGQPAGIRYHLVRGDEIEARRMCAQDQGIWRQWYGKMCLKSIINSAYSAQAVPTGFTCGVPLELALGAATSATGEITESESTDRALPYEPREQYVMDFGGDEIIVEPVTADRSEPAPAKHAAPTHAQGAGPGLSALGLPPMPTAAPATAEKPKTRRKRRAAPKPAEAPTPTPEPARCGFAAPDGRRCRWPADHTGIGPDHGHNLGAPPMAVAQDTTEREAAREAAEYGGGE